MKRYQAFLVLSALAASVLFAGCWSSSKSTSLDLTEAGSPIANAATVGVDKCYSCHSAWRRAGEDNTIFNNWLASKHGTPTASHTGDSCNPCHNPSGDDQNRLLVAGSNGSSVLGSGAAVGCEACHGGGSEHNGVGPIGSAANGYYARAASAGQSSQYNTCTGCHLLPPDRHSTRPDRWIVDTHYDNGARAVGSDIQGYVMRKGLETACTDCHVAHEFNNTINTEWHASGHGSFSGEAWKHYKWTGTDRKTCQRCHTTTGFANFATNPTGYNPDGNYSASSPFRFAAVDNQSEMLYCYGCHSNVTAGTTRNPGALSLTYPDNSVVAFGDLKNSNICVACHSGSDRGTGIRDSTANFADVSFINSHYFTAAGTLAKSSGYEFAGVSYANPSYFKHDKIGVDNSGGTGSTTGPCVGCHMAPADGRKHLFAVVALNADNTIASIKSQATCNKCHTTYPIDNTILETEAEEFQASLDALQDLMASRNFFFAPSYPYIFRTADNTARTNGVKNWGADNTIGRNNMGACFNFNLLSHEPGAYAHNRYYAKRLIFDSIDWLDNYALDNSVKTTLDNATYAGRAYHDHAVAYLSPAGARP